MVAVIVQPENHGRVAGQLHQQFAEAAHAVLAEHDNLLGQLRRVVHLGVAGGKKLVPEEGHLFFQRPLRVDHPVDPLGLVQGRAEGALVAGHEAVEQLGIHWLLLFGMEQFLHCGLVSFGGARHQFFIRCAETGTAHEVAHECDLFFVRHKRPS